MSNLSVAQVDAQIFIHAEKLGVKNIAKADLKTFNLCQIWTVVSPIIGFARSIIAIFKSSWLPYIDAFTAALNAECTIVPPVPPLPASKK
jgi:hypothetical protein